jgi:hypothetical protein
VRELLIRANELEAKARDLSHEIREFAGALVLEMDYRENEEDDDASQ